MVIKSSKSVVLCFLLATGFVSFIDAQISAAHADAMPHIITTLCYERVTSLGDITQEQKLFVAAFMAAYSDEKDHFERIGIFDMRDYFSSLFREEFAYVDQGLQAPSPIYFVRALIDGKVAGFITFNEEKPHQIYIRWLAVSPAFGRHGIGKGLVNFIKNVVPDAQQLVLVTYKLDKPAMNFWKNKMGFTPSDYSRPEYDAAMFQGYTYNL